MKSSIVLTLFVLCEAIAAQSLQEVKLTASDGAASDTFGFAVAISGDYAIVGANEVNFSTGAAYIFQQEESGWQQLTKLVPADIVTTGYFGFSVAMEDDHAVVGARNDDDNGAFSGSIYIYERDGDSWSQSGKIISDDGRLFDYFGNSVAISGDDIIVGSPGDDVSSGAAFIIHRDVETGDWALQQKLTASDRAANEFFGISVSISGDYAIVGTNADDDNGYQSGSAYIFKKEESAWQQQDKLTASDAMAEDIFGGSVGISGNYAIIGALGNDEKAPGAGAAYIFKRDSITEQWSEYEKLVASDGVALDQFGNAVSISGDYAIVGAIMQFNSGKGAAYLFKHEGENWIEQNIITASDGVINDRFGNSVAISGNQAIVGARFDDDHGENSGSAYIYSGFATTVGIVENRDKIPSGIFLAQNYPNPFNPTTVIRYRLSEGDFHEVKLKVFDRLGREVITLVNEQQPSGDHKIVWDARDRNGRLVASGVYLYQLRVGAFLQRRKMVVVR